jgi:N-acetyl-gamma-glutamyl-phosphate reductase
MLCPSALLALTPFVKEGLIELDGITIDSYSGLSGAGRQYNQAWQSVRGHGRQHARTTSACTGTRRRSSSAEPLAAKKQVVVTFVPHVVPLDRGILTTAFARPKAGVTTARRWNV